MRTQNEIRFHIAQLRALISQYRGDPESAPGDEQSSGEDYTKAMYASAAMHALQWVIGELDELILLDKQLLSH